MNMNNLEACTPWDERLNDIQQIMAEHNRRKGYDLFIELYSDYCYLVCIKEGVRNGIKRLNRTGHDTYVA